MSLGAGNPISNDGAVDAGDAMRYALATLLEEYKGRQEQAHRLAMESRSANLKTYGVTERKRMNGAIKEIEAVLQYVNERQRRFIKLV